MRDRILEIVREKPRHYTRLIRRDAELWAWVEANTLASDCDVATLIYSAVYQKSNVCAEQQIMHLDRWGSGLAFCGPAGKCACNKASSAKKVSATKQAYDQQRREGIEKKRAKTMVSKYGVAYNLRRADVIKKLQRPRIPSQQHALLTNRTWLEQEYVTKGRSLVDIAQELNVYYGTVAEYCRKFDFPIRRRANYSLEETQIAGYLESLGEVVEQGNWSVLKNRELDLVIHSKKFAVEVNGLYWHSGRDEQHRNRHLSKTVDALAAGYDVFHITDAEWRTQTEIIKSMLSAKLGHSAKVFARNTKATALTTEAARQFFTENHLQGFSSGQYYLGLALPSGELVAAMVVGRNRFSKSAGHELIRFASRKFTTVVGGLSKLLSFAKTQGVTSLASYCDRSKSTGHGYLAAGFRLVSTTGPGYFWTDGSSVISRYRAQKHRLGRLFENVDLSKTEAEIMTEQGFRRFWDCGNLVFEVDLQTKK